jgi:hypothetical protein
VTSSELGGFAIPELMSVSFRPSSQLGSTLGQILLTRRSFKLKALPLCHIGHIQSPAHRGIVQLRFPFVQGLRDTSPAPVSLPSSAEENKCTSHDSEEEEKARDADTRACAGAEACTGAGQ